MNSEFQNVKKICEFQNINKIFISGPMRGYPDDNKKAFYEAEKVLEGIGFQTFNPARMRFSGSSWDREDIWKVDLAALDICDGIYQLPNWSNSDGALVEAAYAMLKKKANVTSFVNETCPFLSKELIENENRKDDYEKRESE